MKRAIAVMIVITLIAVAGVGLAAVYTGTTHTSSPVSYEDVTIDVTNRDGSGASAITFTGPEYNSSGSNDVTYTVYSDTVNIDDYKLTLSDDMYVRAAVLMDDSRSWWMIDSIVITVYQDTSCTQAVGTYEWHPTSAAAPGVGDTWASWMDYGDVWVADVPSALLLRTSYANYVDIDITFRSCTITVNSNETPEGSTLGAFLNMSGRIVFSAAADDPMA
jgi:hypothetical protein